MHSLDYVTPSVPFGGLVSKIAFRAGLEIPSPEYHTDLERVFDVAQGIFKGGGNKKVVLILDDIDTLQGLEEKQRTTLLGQLSAVKRLPAEKKMLIAMLALTNVPGDYLHGTIGHSPFNAAQRIIAPFFSKEEHNELFGQFERQEGFVIDSRIKDFIYHQTDGAPGLEQIYGTHYARMWKACERSPPTYSDWLSDVMSQNFLRWICSTFPNYDAIFDILSLNAEDNQTRNNTIAFLSDLVHKLFLAILSSV